MSKRLPSYHFMLDMASLKPIINVLFVEKSLLSKNYHASQGRLLKFLLIREPG